MTTQKIPQLEDLSQKPTSLPYAEHVLLTARHSGEHGPTLTDIAACALSCSDTEELAETALWQLHHDLLVLEETVRNGTELTDHVVAGFVFGMACRTEAALDLLKKLRDAGRRKITRNKRRRSAR